MANRRDALLHAVNLEARRLSAQLPTNDDLIFTIQLKSLASKHQVFLETMRYQGKDKDFYFLRDPETGSLFRHIDDTLSESDMIKMYRDATPCRIYT